jgi:hypothetical protein
VYVFRAVDLDGYGDTTDKISTPFTVNVDNSNPLVAVTPTVNVVHSPSINFMVAVTDALGPPPDGTPFYYRIDNGLFVQGALFNGNANANASASSLSNGMHTLSVIANDAAGNSTLVNASFSYSAVTTFGQAQVQARLVDQTNDPVGTLKLSEPLDLDTSPGVSAQAMNAALVYSSATVNVRPVVQVVIQTPSVASLIGPTLRVTARIANSPLLTRDIDAKTFTPGDVLTVNFQTPSSITSTAVYNWQVDVFGKNGNAVAHCQGSAPVTPLDASPFGAGWTLSCLDSLTKTGSDVIRTLATGTALLYTANTTNGSAAYKSPVGDNGTLLGVPNGGQDTPNLPHWVYSLPTGENRWYNYDGNLIRWESADHSQRVIFHYVPLGSGSRMDSMLSAVYLPEILAYMAA